MKDLRMLSAEDVRIVVPSGDLASFSYRYSRELVRNLPLSALEMIIS